ncbi:YeiH family protein [Flavobacterium sp. ASW18X]|uniref:YeiH family protein n=1 Tax=Flavobacterium sp. ASW18X TaxID=2572595 RepID=UPI0010AECC31|nr:putative sulfate exporter family transporter [Flavobacterium sp. ASW18X]TKD67004.1 putative sulfate exporter family transporter [Flavobacterium sp. ASW18X]
MSRFYLPVGITLTVLVAVFFNKISAPIALTLGLLIGLSGLIKKKPVPYHAPIQKKLLKLSVIGLGFGINLSTAIAVGSDSFGISLFGITLTFLIAFGLALLLKSDKTITFLVASGTAICGGSAIAAVSTGIKAKPHQTSIALAVVFLLNSVALFLFPPIAHFFELSQNQFGVWCALAIHDTSSVIGASNSYGEDALLVATTTKLVRALWIVPLVVLVSFKSKEFNKKSFPYFILAFLAAILLNTYLPNFETVSIILVWISKRLLVFTLFLIGLSINMAQIKQLGSQTFLIGLFTWLILALVSFGYVTKFVS